MIRDPRKKESKCGSGQDPQRKGVKMSAERIIEDLGKTYQMVRCTAPEYDTFSMTGMDFEAQGYEVEGMGHVSVMTASGMGGQMSMESLIISPKKVDAPLFSLDRISAGGKEMLYMELYDTLVKADRDEEAFAEIAGKYSNLADLPGKPCWYDDIRYEACVTKAGTAQQAEDFDHLVEEYSDAYLHMLRQAPVCDEAQKTAKADAYRDGLLNNGGPATDGFLKAWGTEKTRELFEKVLFG